MKKQILEYFSPLIAVLPVLLISFGLDHWRNWVNGSAILFNGYAFFAHKIAINLLFAIILIAFYWFVNIRSRPNRLGAGMLIITATFLIFFPLLTALGSIRRLIYLQINPLYPTSLLSFACVFIIIIAVFGLFRRPEEKTATETSNLPNNNKIITPDQQDTQP